MNEKKKVTVVGISLVLFVAILSFGSVFIYKKFTEEKKIVDRSDVLFTLDNIPEIDGSTATSPLMDAFIADFTGKDISDITKKYSQTHPSYLKLIDGEVDLIIVTEPSEEEMKYAELKGVELEVTKVVNEAFVFFVNKDSQIEDLTLEEIRGIYSGKYTNWKELNGQDEKIIAFQRPENSGSQTGMLSLVMNGIKMKKPVTIEYQETMMGIIDVVADYKSGVGSIGYSYYYYANTMYSKENIKMIGVNGIKPTFETIRSGEYPIMSAYYIVTRKDADANTKKLRDVMLSVRGQDVAKEVGYVPVK